MFNIKRAGHRALKNFGRYFLFKVLYKVEVEGIENIPQQGGAVLASSHASFLDPMALFHIIPREYYALAAKWLFKIWWLGWIIRAANCVPTNGSSQGAIALLKRGGMVLIFPEGRLRNPFDTIHYPEPHRGVAVLALKTGAPVIPIGIKGVHEAWPRGKVFPRFFRKIKVRIGPPLAFDRCTKAIIPKGLLEETLKAVMSSIKELIK